MAKLFDVTKEGKGVSREQVNKKKGLMLFLDIYFRRFWKLVLLNLVYMLVASPVIYLYFKYVQMALIAYMGFNHIGPDNTEAMTAAIRYTPVLVLLLVQFCGAGPATAGFNYVLRKYVEDKHAWVWADFLKGMKENFKQAIATFLINAVAVVAIVKSMLFYNYIQPEMSMLSGFLLVIGIFFIMMQMYTYRLMVTFKYSLKQIYRNSALMVIIKLPLNIFVFLVSSFILYILCSFAASVPPAVLFFSFLVIMLVFYSVVTLVQVFMTRKIVEKYLIELPALKEKAEAMKKKKSKEYNVEETDTEFEDFE